MSCGGREPVTSRSRVSLSLDIATQVDKIDIHR